MNLQEEIDLQEKGKIARKNAKELICDKCIYIGQIKDCLLYTSPSPRD